MKFSIGYVDYYEIKCISFNHLKSADEISREHSCINVKNTDNAYFVWAVVSALFLTDKHSKRTSSNPY